MSNTCIKLKYRGKFMYLPSKLKKYCESDDLFSPTAIIVGCKDPTLYFSIGM